MYLLVTEIRKHKASRIQVGRANGKGFDMITGQVSAPDVAIDERDIRQYELDGAICLRGLISAEWIERLRDATEQAIAVGVDMGNLGDEGKFVGDLNLWMKHEEFRAFALEGPSWQIARALMRSSEVRLFSDQLFVKEPGATTPTPWHHDQTYWPVLGDHVCSVWVALDPVSKETSGLEYVRGSHRWGRRFEPQAFGEKGFEALLAPDQEEIPDIDADREQFEFLSWDLEPGDCLVHHSLAIHGAGGNQSQSQRRRALATRWFGDEAYFSPNALFTPEMTGLSSGDRMGGPLFPLVPVTGDIEMPPIHWETEIYKK